MAMAPLLIKDPPQIYEIGRVESIPLLTVEPSIGHLKADHRMRRNFLKGALSDAMNPILAAAGFNIRWLMRWLVIFWRWVLSGVLRLMDQGGTDTRSDLVSVAA